MDNKDTRNILDGLGQPFPLEAIKTREGGGKRRLSYVEGHTVIRRLNEVCGEWSFSVIREWNEGDLLKAHGCLTIPGLGSREHIGVQKVSPNGGEDLHKGAITDSLKKCATLFGVGLELYGPDYEGEPDDPRRNPGPARQDRNDHAPPRSTESTYPPRQQGPQGGQAQRQDDGNNSDWSAAREEFRAAYKNVHGRWPSTKPDEESAIVAQLLDVYIAGWANPGQFREAAKILLSKSGNPWPAQGAPNEDGWTAARKGFRQIAYENGHILPPMAQKDACKQQEVALIKELTGPDLKLRGDGWPFPDGYERAAGAIVEIARRGSNTPQDDFNESDGAFE